MIGRTEAEKRIELAETLRAICELGEGGYARSRMTDVDDHHDRLLERFAEFSGAVLDERLDVEALVVLARSFVMFLEDHFAVEEKLMELTEYGDAENHAKHHRRFMDGIVLLLQEIRVGAKTYADFGLAVGAWLLAHEGEMDRELAEHAAGLVG